MTAVNTLNSTLMKGLFAFAFLLGAALILYSKLHLQSLTVAIGAPNLIICAYAALVASQPKVHRSASDADNLYYLGFLFTIVSLGSTLFTFDANNASSLASSLIPSFGVALSTTIVGLLLRTLLLPHVIDIGQQDQAARVQLYEATNEFIKALSGNTQKLNEAFDGNTVRLAQAFQVAADAVGTSLPKEANQITRVLQDFNEQTGSSLGATLLEIQRFPIAIKQTTENLDVEHSQLLMDNMRVFQETAAGFMEALKVHNEQIGKLGTSIESLRTRVEDVRVDPELLNNHVGHVYEIYKRAAESAATGFAMSSENFTHAITNYATATEKLQEQLHLIAASMAQLDASRVSSLIEKALEPINSSTQTLLAQAQHQAESQQSMHAIFSKLLADLRSRPPFYEQRSQLGPQGKATFGETYTEGTR
jgi:hypothetical protein